MSAPSNCCTSCCTDIEVVNVPGGPGEEGPTGPVSNQGGSGSPEGVVTADPFVTYLDTDVDDFWVKKTGVGNTGWIRLIASLIILFCSLSAFCQNPIRRNDFSTNTPAAALTLVTNVATTVSTTTATAIATNAATINIHSNVAYLVASNYVWLAIQANGVTTNLEFYMTNSTTGAKVTATNTFRFSRGSLTNWTSP